MSNNLSSEEALPRYRQTLEKLEAVQMVRDSRWEKTLSLAKDWQKPGIQKQWDELKAKSNDEINRLNLLIANAEEQIAKRTKKTRETALANLAAQKQNALTEWINGGGTNESFEAAWPEMEKEILKHRTLKAISPMDQKRADLIKHTGGL